MNPEMWRYKPIITIADMLDYGACFEEVFLFALKHRSISMETIKLQKLTDYDILKVANGDGYSGDGYSGDGYGYNGGYGYSGYGDGYGDGYGYGGYGYGDNGDGSDGSDGYGYGYSSDNGYG